MKNSLIELIKKSREEFEGVLFESIGIKDCGIIRRELESKLYVDEENIKSHTTKTLLQLFEAEVERLEGMKKNESMNNIYTATEIRIKQLNYHYNKAIQSQITHLSEVIEFLKNNEN